VVNRPRLLALNTPQADDVIEINDGSKMGGYNLEVMRIIVHKVKFILRIDHGEI